MRKVFVVLAAVTVVGCATTMDVPLQRVATLSSGEMVEMVAFDQKDPSGVNSREAFLFFKNKGELKVIGKSDFSGQGWVNGFMQGGFAGLAQGAGLVGGAALLRPSNTNVNNGPGAGASGDGAGATGAGAGGNIVNNNTATSKSVAKQSQSQIQTQTQTQKQKALGGAGGAGGAGGSVNVTGGIGNSTISAKGNAVVQTGSGALTTGANSPVTQF